MATTTTRGGLGGDWNIYGGNCRDRAKQNEEQGVCTRNEEDSLNLPGSGEGTINWVSTGMRVMYECGLLRVEGRRVERRKSVDVESSPPRSMVCCRPEEEDGWR